MRLLHLFASPVWSGPADLIATLASAQRALGHDARIAVDRKRAHPPAEEPIVPRLRALGLLDDGGLELSVKSGPLALLRDWGALRRRAVDVIHAHFSHDHHLARLAAPRSAVLIRSIHAPRSLKGLPRAHGYTVPCATLLNAVPHRRAIVLPALVDAAFVPPPDRAALRAKLGFSGEPLIGIVSTFKPSRRHELGLKAFLRVLRERPGARLLLAGDGAGEAALRVQVERDPQLRQRVTFAGYRSGPAFVSLLQALDEVWILGLGNDYSARAAAQARACGVRVVAVDEGALAEYADALVPTPDPDAVAEASLGGARRSVRLESPAQIAERVLSFYEVCR
ncbi:MAG: glycosyltransferase [Myxococcaceae bacterium]|nr:glycosyltransferase [Myxococcaceae bacterium]